MPAVSQVLSFSLKDESHINVNDFGLRNTNPTENGTSLLLLFLRHSRWTFGFVSLEKMTGFGPCGFQRTAGHFAKSAA